MDILYSPYNEALWPNPWPTYSAMQKHAPAYFIADLNCWALTRFQDIWAASMDRVSFTARHGTSPDALFLSDGLQPEIFLFLDPPQHGKHRDIIARSYQKEKVALLDCHVRGIVKELMKPALETGILDVYQLASQTALFTIADFIGLTRPQILRIRTFINAFYQREPGVRGTTENGKRAFMEARAYILDLVQNFRRSLPAEHAHITSWINAIANDRAMTDDEIFFSIFAMVITGSDTVPLTTAAALYYLYQNPVQLALLRDDESLALAAFEEAARYDQPTNLLGRRLVGDLSLHGKRLQAGQSVLFLYAAACRDPHEFERPEVFDIQRRPSRSLSFGTGLHFCLGQHLARIEGRVLLEEIFRAIPEFEIKPAECRRIFGEFLQGFSSLPLYFRPR